MQAYSTPAKAKHASRIALPFTARASVTRSIDSSLYEPSPASTYGETLAGESPATPCDSNDSGPRSALTRSLPLATIADEDGHDVPSSAASVKHPIYGLTQSRLCKQPAADGHERSLGATGRQSSAVASPSKLVNISGDVDSSQNDFVVKAKSTQNDDPFTSPGWMDGGAVLDPVTPRHRQHAKGLFDTPSRRIGKTAHITDTPSSASTSSKTSRDRKKATVVSPREDRLGQRPTAENAQAIFPPDACVFVANLPSACTDEKLERLVTDAFEVFGTVYVKIRRDSRGMPYAFCQYEEKTHADKAIVDGKGIGINGRHCRTEIAKVQRALFVSRHDGRQVNEDEVRKLAEPYGPIEKFIFPSETERELFKLPLGMWVRFAYFQDCRDAYAGLRDDTDFRFDQRQEAMPKESPLRSRPLQSRRTISGGSNASVFVGNLPPSITHEELLKVFGKYGVISDSQIICRLGRGSVRSCFAFLEFISGLSVQRAIDGEDGKLTLHGHNVHVERKQPVGFSGQGSMLSPNSYRSPLSTRNGHMQWGMPQFPAPVLDYSQALGTVPRGYPHYLHGQVPFAPQNPTAASPWQQRPEYNMREPVLVQHGYGHAGVAYGFPTLIPNGGSQPGNHVGMLGEAHVNAASGPLAPTQSGPGYYLPSQQQFATASPPAHPSVFTGSPHAQQQNYSLGANNNWISYPPQELGSEPFMMHHGYSGSKMSALPRQA